MGILGSVRSQNLSSCLFLEFMACDMKCRHTIFKHFHTYAYPLNVASVYKCLNYHDSDQHIVQILIFMSIERIWYGIMGYMIDVTLLRYFSLLYPYPHLSMWNMISWIYYFSARLCTEYFPPAQVGGDIRISQEAAQPGHLPLKSDRLLLRLCTTFQLLPQFYQFNSPTIKSVTSWKS